ncbi:MAG: alpha/beta hydrolase [Ardenticatenales bacterium]|nr:alpha/beta hydrolase [Ardenticatenales bacterium]
MRKPRDSSRGSLSLTPHFEPYIAPGVVGRVLRWSAVPSAHLKHPRDVLVWLPPDYASAPDRRYPVLYLQDGQNKFDPATSFAGEDWQVDNTAMRLIERGEIEPFIMVAIYNSPDRMHEYNPMDRGSDYGRFIVEELRPVIDREFRTRGERSNAAMGSSLGALISLALLMEHPSHFFGAACLSPALWILWRMGGPNTWLRRHAIPPQPMRLYLDHGSVSHEARIGSHIKAVMSYMREHGVPKTALHYLKAEGGDHNERSWRARAEHPLRYLFGKT